MRTGGVRYGTELVTLSYILHHIVCKVRHKTNAFGVMSNWVYSIKSKKRENNMAKQICTCTHNSPSERIEPNDCWSRSFTVWTYRAVEVFSTDVPKPFDSCIKIGYAVVTKPMAAS